MSHCYSGVQESEIGKFSFCFWQYLVLKVLIENPVLPLSASALLEFLGFCGFITSISASIFAQLYSLSLSVPF